MPLPLLSLGLAISAHRLRPQDLAADLASLKVQIQEFQGQKREIDSLRAEFVSIEPRLTQLELDFELMRRKTTDLDRRLLWLEAAKPSGKHNAKVEALALQFRYAF